MRDSWAQIKARIVFVSYSWSGESGSPCCIYRAQSCRHTHHAACPRRTRRRHLSMWLRYLRDSERPGGRRGPGRRLSSTACMTMRRRKHAFAISERAPSAAPDGRHRRRFTSAPRQPASGIEIKEDHGGIGLQIDAVRLGCRVVAR